MYEIKIVSDEEFDNLPVTETRGSNVSYSSGFANKYTGRAYVRNTKSHDLNKFLVNHELEELQSKVSNHEDENGIRHFKFLAPLFGAIMSGLGSLGGMAASAAPAIGGALASSIPSIASTAMGMFGSGGSQGGQQAGGQQMSQAAFSNAPAPMDKAPDMANPAGGFTDAGQPATTENPLSGDITSSIKASELGSVGEDDPSRDKGFYQGRLNF